MLFATGLIAHAVLAQNTNEVAGRVARVESDIAWLLALNASVLEVVRTQALPPPLVARNLAILHLAVEEAWMGGDTTRVACALGAGETVAEILFPGWQPGAMERAARVAGAGSEHVTARRLGRSIADRWLAKRSDDEANHFFNYTPSDLPARWRRTHPFYRPPELPNWSRVTPFAVKDITRFVWPGPPSLQSAEWAQACRELERVGGRANAQRTADETEIARFWSDFSYTCTPPGHWNQIAADVVRQEKIAADVAVHLFAVLNVAMADAGICGWEAKYRFDFWRPVTAINPEADPSKWLPFLTTPAHPEYPSGHSFFSGAAAEVLKAILGRDECAIATTSDALPGVVRRFESFSAIAQEVSRSRVLAGIHYTFSCQDGLNVGREIAREVLQAARVFALQRSETLVQR